MEAAKDAPVEASVNESGVKESQRITCQILLNSGYRENYVIQYFSDNTVTVKCNAHYDPNTNWKTITYAQGDLDALGGSGYDTLFCFTGDKHFYKNSNGDLVADYHPNGVGAPASNTSFTNACTTVNF